MLKTSVKMNVFKRVPGEYEAIYCEDYRFWSKSNFILWVEIATDCHLGCKNCHWHRRHKTEHWLRPEELSYMKRHIERIEGKEARLHITPTLGDILLSPYLKDILMWCVNNEAIINLMSFMPQMINLKEVDTLLDYFEGYCCLCWSLHAYSDKERYKIFNRPHLIRDVLPVINKNRGGLRNTVYSYSQENDYKMLEQFDPRMVRIIMIPFVDYHSNTIITNKSLIKYPNQRVLEPNMNMMSVAYPDREFTII